MTEGGARMEPCSGNNRMAGQRTLSTHGGARKRAAVYCRVSTEKELQEGSFELQVKYYRELIVSRPDMELVDVYGDKGRTGRSIADRPDFRRMLADCEAGRIDLILTKSISRFARNMGECVGVLRRLKELGIPVMFEKENLNSMEAQGELMLSIFAAIAQEESHSIGLNVLWTNERHNAAGQPRCKASYGYVRERDGWRWRVDEAEARRVRLAFQMASEGRSYKDIRRELNAMEQEEGTGLHWTQRRLGYLLANENYTGDCLTNRYVARADRHRVKVNEGERAQYYIENHHEALVSRELFEAVRDKIQAGALHSRRKWRQHEGEER